MVITLVIPKKSVRLSWEVYLPYLLDEDDGLQVTLLSQVSDSR